MAQSANTKGTPFAIDASWGNSTSDPLSGGKSGGCSKKLLYQRTNFFLIFCLDLDQNQFNYTWTEKRGDYTGNFSSIRTWTKSHKCVKKMNWQSNFQMTTVVGIIWWDKPRVFGDRKTLSLLYLSICIEERRILNCKSSHTLALIWLILNLGISYRRHSYASATFIFNKQDFMVTNRIIYFKKWQKNFENKEETFFKEAIITIKMVREIQRKLLMETALKVFF